VLYPLTPSDALATLIDLYPPDAHPGLPFLADLLRQPACRAWYTADADQVTAAIWYLSTGTHAELIDLIVAPSARGLGIGRTILEQSSSALINLGIRTVELEVRESNGAARALYKKIGFVRSGRRRNYYPSESGREDAILMTCDLSENGSL
jgi:ribosomal protein S18 acetylase RimI-like enzyme